MRMQGTWLIASNLLTWLSTEMALNNYKYTDLGFMIGSQSGPKSCPTMKWVYLHKNTKRTVKFNRLL